MTLKQREFVKKYLQCGNTTEAAFNVYNVKKRSTAAQIGYENLRKHEIKQAIQGYLEREERTPFYVAEAFAEVLKNGTTSQKLNASIAYFKLMGLT